MQEYVSAVQVFKALAHLARLRILEALEQKAAAGAPAPQLPLPQMPALWK
jgi:hypothetical protein